MSNDRSGFTGIDGQRAARDINHYYEEAYSLLSDYTKMFTLFADYLEKSGLHRQLPTIQKRLMMKLIVSYMSIIMN